MEIHQIHLHWMSFPAEWLRTMTKLSAQLGSYGKSRVGWASTLDKFSMCLVMLKHPIYGNSQIHPH